MGLKLETLMYLSSCSVRLLVRVSEFFFILFFFLVILGLKLNPHMLKIQTILCLKAIFSTCLISCTNMTVLAFEHS